MADNLVVHTGKAIYGTPSIEAAIEITETIRVVPL